MLAAIKQFGRALRQTFGGSTGAQAADMDFGGHWRPGYRGGIMTAAGEVVSEDKAMTLPAVFCAAWNLCSHLAMLKRPLLRRDASGNYNRLRDDPRDQMFNLEANADATSMTARQTRHFHALMWGKSVCEIVRNGRDQASGFIPLDPDRVRIGRESGRLVFKYTQPDGTEVTLRNDEVLHVPGMSRDGVTGYSLIKALARENLGMQMAIERYAQSFFGNGVGVGTIFKYPGTLKPEVFKQHLEEIRSEYSGPQNRGKPFIAHGGVEVDREGPTNKEAMMIESLTWSAGDVARWMNIPLHFLKELSRATFSNIEQLSLDYVKYSLSPWVVLFDQEDSRKLLTSAERATHKFEHNLNDLLRGDVKTRTEYYQLMRECGMSPNDILRLENMHSIGPAGDQHLVQLNMTTLENMLRGRAEGDGGEDPQASELAFKREVVKALIADGTIGDVIFNLMKVRDLLREVNIQTTDGPEEPWLPVVASSGPLVSGETITDDEGDIVGGDTVGGATTGGDTANAAPPPPTGDAADAQDEATDDDENAPDDAMQQATALLTPIWEQAVVRIRTRVTNQVRRKAGKPIDAIVAEQAPKAVAELWPVCGAVCRSIGVTEETVIRGATEHMADGLVVAIAERRDDDGVVATMDGFVAQFRTPAA